MINPTAWPLSSAELGLPVLKKKALLDEFSNKEGFSETCRMVATCNPQLWDALLAESPHWKLWGQHLKLGILLQKNDIQFVEKRLQFLQEQLSCNWSIILPLHFRRMNKLPENLRESIQKNRLKIIRTSSQHGDVLESLLNIDHDWIAVASPTAWNQPNRWALLERKIIRQPDRHLFSGDPVVIRRHWWLKQGGERDLVHKNNHEPIQLSPHSID